MTVGPGFWDDAEVISVYTRTQAIDDGTLVELPHDGLAAEAGFRCSVALTRELWTLVEPNKNERQQWGQSIDGRLWDLLNLARLYRPRPIPDDGAEWRFRCIFLVQRDGKRGVHREVSVKAHLGPGDAGEPVVTIMLGHES